MWETIRVKLLWLLGRQLALIGRCPMSTSKQRVRHLAADGGSGLNVGALHPTMSEESMNRKTLLRFSALLT
ncbi:MAG: hypothetical protein ABI887_21085, partial [Burkholderiales bacterium]